jgi:hypothetical protein
VKSHKFLQDRVSQNPSHNQGNDELCYTLSKAAKAKLLKAKIAVAIHDEMVGVP